MVVVVVVMVVVALLGTTEEVVVEPTGTSLPLLPLRGQVYGEEARGGAPGLRIRSLQSENSEDRCGCRGFPRAISVDGWRGGEADCEAAPEDNQEARRGRYGSEGVAHSIPFGTSTAPPPPAVAGFSPFFSVHTTGAGEGGAETEVAAIAENKGG